MVYMDGEWARVRSFKDVIAVIEDNFGSGFARKTEEIMANYISKKDQKYLTIIEEKDKHLKAAEQCIHDMRIGLKKAVKSYMDYKK